MPPDDDEWGLCDETFFQEVMALVPAIPTPRPDEIEAIIDRLRAAGRIKDDADDEVGDDA